MRIVTLEDHFTVPELSNQIDPDVIVRRGWPRPGSPQAALMPQDRLRDTGTVRLGDLDASGITVQVLSLAGPGADLLDPQAGPALARQFNDRLAAIVHDGEWYHVSTPEGLAADLRRPAHLIAA